MGKRRGKKRNQNRKFSAVRFRQSADVDRLVDQNTMTVREEQTVAPVLLRGLGLDAERGTRKQRVQHRSAVQQEDKKSEYGRDALINDKGNRRVLSEYVKSEAHNADDACASEKETRLQEEDHKFLPIKDDGCADNIETAKASDDCYHPAHGNNVGTDQPTADAEISITNIVSEANRGVTSFHLSDEKKFQSSFETSIDEESLKSFLEIPDSTAEARARSCSHTSSRSKHSNRKIIELTEPGTDKESNVNPAQTFAREEDGSCKELLQGNYTSENFEVPHSPEGDRMERTLEPSNSNTVWAAIPVEYQKQDDNPEDIGKRNSEDGASSLSILRKPPFCHSSRMEDLESLPIGTASNLELDQDDFRHHPTARIPSRNVCVVEKHFSRNSFQSHGSLTTSFTERGKAFHSTRRGKEENPRSCGYDVPGDGNYSLSRNESKSSVTKGKKWNTTRVRSSSLPQKRVSILATKEEERRGKSRESFSTPMKTKSRTRALVGHKPEQLNAQSKSFGSAATLTPQSKSARSCSTTTFNSDGALSQSKDRGEESDPRENLPTTTREGEAPQIDGDALVQYEYGFASMMEGLANNIDREVQKQCGAHRSKSTKQSFWSCLMPRK